MNTYLDRPRRHRIVAIVWRILAFLLFVSAHPSLLGLFCIFAFLLLATLHDLVAAALRPKFIIANAMKLREGYVLDRKLGGD